MRNLVSKILHRIASARLFPASAPAPAREQLVSNAPLLLLLAGLAAAPFLEIASGRFDEIRHFNDAQSLALASNLSPEHRFLMFFRQYADADGELRYVPYNRYPIGFHLLIKAAIIPFGDSVSAQILAVRLLTVAFFSAAAALAYLSLRRLTNQPWIALSTVLLAFSSYYALRYGDMVHQDAIGVFGVMLTFHGMTIFVQEGRFRQLLVKALASVLLSWIVMFLLLPFAALGLASAIFRVMREKPSSPLAAKARAAFAAFISSRYLRLGAAPLLIFALVVVFQMANEYIALRGEVPLLDLPSARSPLAKTVIGVETLGYPGPPAWPALIELLMERVGGASLPYFILTALGHGDYGAWGDWERERTLGSAVGAVASAAGLLGLAFTRHKVLMASLLLVGLIWALAFPGSYAPPIHEYEGLFHIGVPLVVYATFLTIIYRRIKWNALWAGAAAAALIVFGLSILQFARFTYSEDPTRTALLSDLDAIRRITQGASVCVGPMTEYAIDYYLSGSVINSSVDPCPFGPGAPDPFVIESARAEVDALLTPENRAAFLYDARRLSESPHETAFRDLRSQQPALQSAWNVYLGEGRLIYAKAPCARSDTRGLFSLRARAADDADLPMSARRDGFSFFTFLFRERGARFDGKCIASVVLPDYPIESIRADQSVGDAVIWSAFFVFDDVSHRLAAAEAALSEPDARGYFDLYLQDARILFLKNPCAPPGADARFFLHVQPVDNADLPQERRQHGFDNLDFGFDERGAFFDGKCAAIADLPAYPIERIRAGQIGDGGEIWEASIALREPR